MYIYTYIHMIYMYIYAVPGRGARAQGTPHGSPVDAHPPSDQTSNQTRTHPPSHQDPTTLLPNRPETRLSCCCPPAPRAAPLRPLSDPSFVLALVTFSVEGVA